ncbi:site-2 protease family protein [Candidatus Woesearchaeota archaeon]|nr:site-2 protease family protein [Candidatus Woesearchaeota archaeon]
MDHAIGHAAKQISFGSIKTSGREIFDLIKAWIAISIAFAMLLSTGRGFYAAFAISSLTVGIGFLLHELGHKLVAQRYGCFAEFRSFDAMLMLAVAMSFFGFVFAAPGAVMITGKVGKGRNGKISMAGPVVNLALALIFLGIYIAAGSGTAGGIAFYGFTINIWLALFNMIPFWNFDGEKILRWSRLHYGIIVAVSFALMLSRDIAAGGIK